MKFARRAPRSVVLPVLTLGVALCVAACGSSSGNSGSNKNASATTTTAGKTGATTSRSSFAAYQTCLKSHGVTLPSGRGDFRGRFGGTGTGTSTTAAPTTGTRPTGAPSSGGFGGSHGGRFGGGGGFGGGGVFGGGTSTKGNSKYAKAFKDCESKLPKGAKGGFGRFGRGAGAGAAGAGFSTKVLDSYVACVRKNGYPSMPEPDTKKGATSVFPASVKSNAKFKAASQKCESILTAAFRDRNRAGGTPPSGSQTSTTSSTTANT